MRTPQAWQWPFVNADDVWNHRRSDRTEMMGFVALGMALGAMSVAPVALAAPVAHAPPAHTADYVVTENAHSGGYFAATSTTSTGGGIYQDVALSTSAGQTVCGSAFVRSQAPSTAANGTFALFLTGGGATDSGGADFGSLPFGDNWTQVHTCVEATGSHTILRIQFYPTPGGPTVEIDDVNVDVSLAANGGFETGSASWAPYPGTGTNFVVYGNTATTAHSGAYWAATNTTSNGGGIYQDIALNTSAGQTVCGSAWVRSEAPATGAGGTFALFLLGSAATDSGGATFGGLSNGNDWTPVHDCVEATGSHTTLRVQFYPTPGGPTVEIDDANVDVSMAANASFEDGAGPWGPYPGTSTNYAVFANASTNAHTGAHFAATNTSDAGGGIYQDVGAGTSPGQTVCGSAWVRTDSTATGASGVFALFQLGESATDSGAANFSGLGNGDNWTEVHTCAEAIASHSSLRIQLYPTPDGPTLDMDDVNVDASLAANGGFENGPGGWVTYPGTNSSYEVIPSGEIKVTVVTPTPVQPAPQPTQIPLGKGRYTLKIKLEMKWSWRFGVTTLRKTTIGRFPRSTRLSMTCTGSGCPRPLKLTAAGPKRIQALLKRLIGRRYRAGDVVTVTFTARGWGRERARVTMRSGHLPRVTRA
jgi:hypothetical protein